MINRFQLFIQVEVGRGFVQALFIHCVCHSVLEIIGTSEVIQFFIRKVKLAAQHSKTL